MKQSYGPGKETSPSRKQTGRRPYRQPTVRSVGRLSSVVFGASVGSSDSGMTSAFPGKSGPLPPH